MIADDEGIVIDSLKYIINKNFSGECEIETAKSGRAVIELAERFRPDIAFMDIHMGGINGIEAMKEIQKFLSDTIFIVVSAYDKFDYAKEAINLGVLEYMNKPIQQKKIVATMQRAMELIQEKRARRSKELLIREKLETVVPIIEAGMINEILFREHFEVDIENYKSLLGIQESYGFMAVFMFGEAQEGSHMTNVVGATVMVQNSYRKIYEIIKEYLHGIVGSVVGNKIPVLIPANLNHTEYGERIESMSQARKLCTILQEQFQVQLRIGIGGIYSLQETNHSFNEALSALEQTTSKIAHVKDLPIGCAYEENYPANLEKQIFEAVEQGNTTICQEKSQFFYQWMLDGYQGQTQDIKLKVLEFVLRAEHIAYESGGMQYRFTSRSDYLPTINSIQDMETLKQWFIDKIVEACRNITVKKMEHSLSQIERAKNYINRNYHNDISLDDVSMELDISPYYFSKLFKEQTEENFIDYLTRIRIQKAKELLIHSKLSVREIGSSVGYQDPNYFSRIFKKNVGMTPTEYKEEIE